MVFDPDAAADIVQDAFIKAFDHLDRCRDPARFGVWIFQILRNRCLDYLRNVRRSDVSLHGRSDLHAAAGGPDQELERTELRARLDAALASLTAPQREAFLLKYVQDLSYEEMARALGTSVGSLKMRVLRARETLQSLLRDSDGSVGGGA